MVGVLLRGLWDFLSAHGRRIAILGLPVVALALGLTYGIPALTAVVPEAARPYVRVLNPRTWAFGILNGGAPIDLGTLTVKVVKIEVRQFEPSIEVSGAVEYFEKINIASRVSGRIEAFHVNEGDTVHSKQLLVQLERLPLQLQLRQESAALDSTVALKRLSQERYEKARQGVEGQLKNIEKLETRARELKAELDKIRVTYERKEQVFKQEGLSQEEFDILKTQVIAREAQYLIARKDLEIARVGFRDEDLKKKLGFVPKEAAARRRHLIDINTLIEKADVDVSNSKVVSAQAALDNTKDLMRETTLRSPITGLVATRNSSVGEQVRGGAAVSPTEAIMVLVKIDPIYVRVSVRESEVSDVRVGGPLLFTVDAFPKSKFQARVTLVGPMVDSKTHTATVKALLSNKDGRLKPGMFIRAVIPTGAPEKMITIPQTALIPREKDRAWVFVVREQRTYRVEVQTGRQLDDRVEIKSGLKPGDLLALEKFGQLRDGLAVRPVPENAPQS